MSLSKSCVVCKKLIVRGRDHGAFRRARFCSKKCYWQSLKGNQLHYKSELHTNEKTLCACGCDQEIPKLDKKYRERIFINGHSTKGKKRPDAVIILSLNRLGHKGKKHWNWKGGKTPENATIRNSAKYSVWRKAVYKRNNWTCQTCKQKQKHPIAHHLKSFDEYPELRFVVENGITLCRPCHNALHRKSKIWPLIQ